MSESKGDFVHLPEPPKNQPKFRSSSLTLANTIAFLTTVHGRDKFYRLLQFAFKQVALVAAQSHPAGEANSVSDSCSKIAGGLVAGRRFLRIGSLPGALQGVQQALDEPDAFLKYTLTGSRLAGLLYLVVDHFSWTSRHSLFRMDYQYWGGYEARLWLLSIVLAIIADVRILYQIAARELSLRVSYNVGGAQVDKQALVEEMRAQELRKQMILIDIVRNLADMPLAINGLFEKSKLPLLLLNTLGLASSWLGCVQVWPASK